jgi:hypothetical protein
VILREKGRHRQSHISCSCYSYLHIIIYYEQSTNIINSFDGTDFFDTFAVKIQRFMKIKEGFVLRQMCGENIVAGEGLEHINFNRLISLNASAAYLWQELVGKDFTVEEMAELLISRYGIDKELAVKDSEALAQAWVEAGIATF